MEEMPTEPTTAAIAGNAALSGGEKPLKPKRSWRTWLLYILLLLAGAAGTYGLDRIERYREKPEYLVSSYPAQAGSSARSDAIAYMNHIASVMQLCNEAINSQVAAEAGTDGVAKYQAAQATQAICVDHDFVRNFPVPRSVGHDAALVMLRASAACDATISFGWLSASYLQDGLKDKGDVAKLSEGRDYETRAWKLRAECRTAMLQATVRFGVTADDVQI